MHGSFTLTRLFEATPSEVFAAFADDTVRRRWVRMPGSGATYQHDFRVGGGESSRAAFTTLDQPTERIENHSTYLELAEGQRIVFAYRAVVDGITRWASLVTVELAPDASGTHLTWTEQVALLAPTSEGSADLAHLRGGTALRLNALALALRSRPLNDRSDPHEN